VYAGNYYALLFIPPLLFGGGFLGVELEALRTKLRFFILEFKTTWQILNQMNEKVIGKNE
jgi:hypothetical protein